VLLLGDPTHHHHHHHHHYNLSFNSCFGPRIWDDNSKTENSYATMTQPPTGSSRFQNQPPNGFVPNEGHRWCVSTRRDNYTIEVDNLIQYRYYFDSLGKTIQHTTLPGNISMLLFDNPQLARRRIDAIGGCYDLVIEGQTLYNGDVTFGHRTSKIFCAVPGDVCKRRGKLVSARRRITSDCLGQTE